jgi:hypothetical protein
LPHDHGAILRSTKGLAARAAGKHPYAEHSFTLGPSKCLSAYGARGLSHNNIAVGRDCVCGATEIAAWEVTKTSQALVSIPQEGFLET